MSRFVAGVGNIRVISGSGMSVVVAEIASVTSGVVVPVGVNKAVPAEVVGVRVTSSEAVGGDVPVGNASTEVGENSVAVGVRVGVDTRVDVGASS